MFAKVEGSLKLDIAAVQSDFGHILERVEELEERWDMYDQKLEMNEQMRSLQRANRSLSYKMEDKENQSCRKNLHIGGHS